MKWLVQEFLNNGSNISRIRSALEHCSVDCLFVRVNQDNTLTVIDKNKNIPCDNSDIILQSFISNEQVMVYGSKKIAEIANQMGLKPGSFMNEQFEFKVFQSILGDELLNNEFVVGELLNLTPIADTFFIRPTGNTKLFTGMSITKEEFVNWQERERERLENSPYIGQNLMMSQVQEIKTEYRFFIVNQEIISASSYKIGDTIDTSHQPSNELIAYTNEIVNRFPLAKAFVVDIAETNKGFKVVEYNNINSSGLYGCNEVLFVQSINRLV